MRSGTKHLRIASIIQIISGAGSFIAAYMLMGFASSADIHVDPKKALLILITTYSGYAFQILAGFFGLLLSNKKSVFTVILGLALFIPQIFNFYHAANSVPLILLNVVFLAIPYYYLHNAYKNLKD